MSRKVRWMRWVNSNLPMFLMMPVFLVGHILTHLIFPEGPIYARALVAGLLAGSLIFALAKLRWLYWTPYRHLDDQMLKRMQPVKNALLRYMSENEGIAPDHWDTLVKEGYLSKIPTNPFTGEPMLDVQRSASPGNYGYFPVRRMDHLGTFRSEGFYLVPHGLMGRLDPCESPSLWETGLDVICSKSEDDEFDLEPLDIAMIPAPTTSRWR